MPAYIVSELSEVHAEGIGAYLALARPSIVKYGGRYLPSTAAVEMLEGGPAPARFVIVEFESAERAREWYRSEDYAAALKARDAALTRRLMLVEGNVD